MILQAKRKTYQFDRLIERGGTINVSDSVAFDKELFDVVEGSPAQAEAEEPHHHHHKKRK